MDEHEKAVEEFIVNEIGQGVEPGTLGREDDLLAAELIDSLGITALVDFLETRFGVTIADEDLTAENFRSIAVIAGFVRAKGG